MDKQYKTVYEGGEGEIVEKKSRFIAKVISVSSEKEANEELFKIRKLNKDARFCTNCGIQKK